MHFVTARCRVLPRDLVGEGHPLTKAIQRIVAGCAKVTYRPLTDPPNGYAADLLGQSVKSTIGEAWGYQSAKSIVLPEHVSAWLRRYDAGEMVPALAFTIPEAPIYHEPEIVLIETHTGRIMPFTNREDAERWTAGGRTQGERWMPFIESGRDAPPF